MITYKETPIPSAINVFLDGRRVGIIRRSKDGFFTYYPSSSPRCGSQAFPTLADCKRSLEQE
jgi:hypothetical protein